MSKSITIQEGGTPVSTTVDRLITNLTQGGTCAWIPEDEAYVSAAVLYGMWESISQMSLPAPSLEVGIFCEDSHSISYFKIAQIGNKNIFCANQHETRSPLNQSAYYGMTVDPVDNTVIYTNSSGGKMNASMALGELRLSGITFTENIKACKCNVSFLDWFSKYFERAER